MQEQDEESIQKYLDQYPQFQLIVTAIRMMVRDRYPGIIEKFHPRWNLIGFKFPVRNKSIHFAFIEVTPNEVRLGFEYGKNMHDPANFLQNIKGQVNFLKFQSLNDMNRQLPWITQYLDEAFELATQLKPPKLLALSS